LLLHSLHCLLLDVLLHPAVAALSPAAPLVAAPPAAVDIFNDLLRSTVRD